MWKHAEWRTISLFQALDFIRLLCPCLRFGQWQDKTTRGDQNMEVGRHFFVFDSKVMNGLSSEISFSDKLIYTYQLIS